MPKEPKAPAPQMALVATRDEASYLVPTSLTELLKFAEFVAKSDIVPKDYRGKPENVAVAIQFGAEIGFLPMQALQGIAVVNGRPAVWGDALRALVLSHPELKDIKETDDGNTATCIIERRGRSPVTHTFSTEDAKIAGLLGKDNVHKTYPKRMRQMRAFGFAARDAFADRLRGFISIEEAREYALDVEVEERREPQALPGTTLTEEQQAHARRVLADKQAQNAAAPAADTKDVTIDGAKVLGVAWVGEKGQVKGHWSIAIQTRDGNQVELKTVDDQIRKEAESIEGAAATFRLTGRKARNGAGTEIVLLTKIDAEPSSGGARAGGPPTDAPAAEGSLLP